MLLAEQRAERTGDGQRHSGMTRVVTVASGKGGVGKTNVSINLAVAQAQLGRRVILLDADLGLANVDVLLNLKVRNTLEDVLEGRCELAEVLLEGPAGVRIVPATSGVQKMATLSSLESGNLVRAFSSLEDETDLMVVDVAAGIHSSVTTFATAAHDVIVVVCDEPGSIADAYALIKVLVQNHNVRRFRVLANMVRNANHGRIVFRKISRVAERYMDVVLRYAGHIPHDGFLQRALLRRESVMTAFPEVGSSLAFKKLASAADNWTEGPLVPGTVGFFFEQFLGRPPGPAEAER